MYKIVGRKREITKRNQWASYWPKTFPEIITIIQYGSTIIAAPDVIEWAVGMYYRRVLFWLIKQDGIVTSVEDVDYNPMLDPKVIEWFSWLDKRNGKKDPA